MCHLRIVFNLKKDISMIKVSNLRYKYPFQKMDTIKDLENAFVYSGTNRESKIFNLINTIEKVNYYYKNKK